MKKDTHTVTSKKILTLVKYTVYDKISKEKDESLYFTW